MYPVELRLTIYTLLILLGLFQGFFLSFFFLSRENRKILSNRFYGLFILAVSLITLEVWLNYTAYITRMISWSNFSEPLNFAIGPLAYLYIRTSIKPDFRRRDYLHFLIFGLYFLYCIFYFIQSDEFKFNSFLWVNHPELERIGAKMIFSEDPMLLRWKVNELTLIHFVVYLAWSFWDLIREVKRHSLNFWKLENAQLRWLRNFLLHFVATMVIFIFVKLYFGRDLGDYFIASYIAFVLYLTSFKVVNDSLFFKKNEVEILKYKKSSLAEEQKKVLLEKLMLCMKEDKYYLNNMASLPDLAKKVGAGSHHVSQVINEQLGKSFFEWLAENRIEAARQALSFPETASVTIEVLAEKVGYNSKSAFNKAFKKYTGKTPSQFRDIV